MGKTRVHLLAKELGIETKDLIAQLDKLGMRGRKAQSALEDDEVARVRAALAAQEKPQVHIGEEKVVADRVVKSEDEAHGEVQARETIVERRVGAGVIRRRTKREEVPQPVAPAAVGESQAAVEASPFEAEMPIEEGGLDAIAETPERPDEPEIESKPALTESESAVVEEA